MLVLTRKQGEEIVIGDNIRISVLKQRGGRVQLGITAPRTVHIARVEILETHASTGRCGPLTPIGDHNLKITNETGYTDETKVKAR